MLTPSNGNGGMYSFFSEDTHIRIEKSEGLPSPQNKICSKLYFMHIKPILFFYIDTFPFLLSKKVKTHSLTPPGPPARSEAAPPLIPGAG